MSRRRPRRVTAAAVVPMSAVLGLVMAFDGGVAQAVVLGGDAASAPMARPPSGPTSTTTTVPATTTTTSSTTTTTTVPATTTTTTTTTTSPTTGTSTTTTTVPPSTTTTTTPSTTSTTTAPPTTTTTIPKKHKKPKKKAPTSTTPASTTTTTTPPAPKKTPPKKTPPPPAPAGTVGAVAAPPTLDDTAYRLPVPAWLVAAHPAWIGEGPAATSATATSTTATSTTATSTTASTARSTSRPATRPARPASLPVPAGTRIKAATSGHIRAVRTEVATGQSGPAPRTVVLVGTDGAVYTYTDVVDALVTPGAHVRPGQRIGSAGQHGITFGIRVPDVAGQVDPTGALQAWAIGTTVDVRALPRTRLTGRSIVGTSVATEHVLVVTDAAAGRTGADLVTALSGSKIRTATLTLEDGATTVRQQAATIAAATTVAPSAAAAGRPQVVTRHVNLIVVALGAGTPGHAAALLRNLPKTDRVLWVAPPARTKAAAASRAAYYLAVVKSHPNLRVETLPSALLTVTSGKKAAATATTAASTSTATVTAPWSRTGAEVVSSLVSTYAGTAYRLPLANAGVATVLGYAEAQIGRPYEWGGAGPATFDCSGLVMKALDEVGIDLVHNAYAQYEATKSLRVSPDALQAGDLVFFGPTEAGIHHVGIYVGNGEMVDAPETGQDVQIESMAGFGFYAATDPLAALSGSRTVAGLGPDQAFARALSDQTWGPLQWTYLDQLWNRESGWNPSASNAASGAYGIPQALPSRKLASAGADWATDPFTQIIWGVGYISQRYGTPQAAWAHEIADGWY